MSTIISHTLPAVVGMGVVAHATDTMFGRRKSKPPKRKKVKAKGRGPKIHKGPRGGKYIIRKGRKVYV